MKIKEGFVLRKIGDKDVVIGEGLDQINFNKIIALNSSAANLWRALAIKDFSEEDAIDFLENYYQIDHQIAEKDAKGHEEVSEISSAMEQMQR